MYFFLFQQATTKQTSLKSKGKENLNTCHIILYKIKNSLQSLQSATGSFYNNKKTCYIK